MPETRVVAVSGSRRDGSYTRRACRIALDAAADEGADTELLCLREWDLPEYDPNLDDDPEVVAEFLREVREADAVVLGSPVYHGSYSSTLKTALDWCGFDEFEDTTTGLLATAGGGNYEAALAHVRAVVRGVHGWTVPHQVGIRKAYDRFDGDELTDDGLRERVEELGEQVTRYAHIDRVPEADAPAADD
jgi:NAD(P)H-dependent FMN reductase